LLETRACERDVGSATWPVSSDGKWLTMITDHGVTFVNLP